jgi:hypothetical protein
VYGCTSNSIKHPESKFYMLPNRVTQPARRDRWLQAINRFDVLKRTRWSPKSDYSYVCHEVGQVARSDYDTAQLPDQRGSRCI